MRTSHAEQNGQEDVGLVRRLGNALGAEIVGLSLSSIDQQSYKVVRRALDEHSVIVFRNQTITPADQIRFTQWFGAVERHPLYRSAVLDGYPEILVLDHQGGRYVNGRNNVWHSDVTFASQPPLGSVLYCKAVQSGLGDTLFCSMRRAYDALSGAMKQLLAGRLAEHSAQEMVNLNNSRDYNVAIAEVPLPVLHPIVRTNKTTGAKSLFINPVYTTRIDGLRKEESRGLLDYLYRTATQPEFIYRHRWRVGDVVMFDNRCTMHYVVPDYGPEVHRLMHRTTAAGEPPV